MERNRVVVGVTAAVVAVGAGAARYGDDAFRAVSHEHPPTVHPGLPPIHVPPTPLPVQSKGPIFNAVDNFATEAADAFGAAPETAREAAAGVACDVLEIVWTEQRFPSESEWVLIGEGAFVDAVVDVPTGSAAWFQLERVKDATLKAATNSMGFPDDDEAQALGEELACVWA